MMRISNEKPNEPSFLQKYFSKSRDQEFWNELSYLRHLIRCETLKNELNATPIEHQIMRPMKGEELCDDETNTKYVKNGQNPQMAYTQVHYLKGYLLLHFLSGSLTGGYDSFFEFLRHYAQGKLVFLSLRNAFETKDKLVLGRIDLLVLLKSNFNLSYFSGLNALSPASEHFKFLKQK